MEGFTTESFCGTEYRTNEIATAILREQLKKLDGIITDLRKNKKYVMDRLSTYCRFIRSNDIDGDLGTTVAILFDSAEEAERFGESVNAKPAIHTGKHVYSNWEPILERRGAFHPLMDPFKMEANKNIIPDYTADMCPITLDLLSRAVYIEINPDWTQEKMDARVDAIIEALTH
jgi:dTDP-4-amino-4,6-dideoxygalactose transaminase